MGGILGQALANLAWSFLKFYLERQEIRNDERRKIALENLESIKAALEWKEANPVNPDSDFRHDFDVHENPPNIERIRDKDS